MHRTFVCGFLLILAGSLLPAAAEPTNLAEDDAAHSGYSGSWDSGKNGGSGFAAWVTTSEKKESDSHAGFYIASTDNNKDLNSVEKEGKAFGLYANGIAFEQAIAYRALNKPLAAGDSFSFMMEGGKFEKKSENNDGVNGAIGLVLRSGNIALSPGDYNAGAMFEFGYFQGKENFQIHDGSKEADSGVAFSDAGVVVTVTVKSAESYDLEIQTLSNKELTKLPDRKFKISGAIESLAVFNRNSEKNDVYFNQFQISREAE